MHWTLCALCSDQYMMRRKRTDEEEKLLKLLQGMKPQDGFTTWCEQMLHALNTSANNSSSSLDGRLLSFYLFSIVIAEIGFTLSLNSWLWFSCLLS